MESALMELEGKESRLIFKQGQWDNSQNFLCLHKNQNQNSESDSHEENRDSASNAFNFKPDAPLSLMTLDVSGDNRLDVKVEINEKEEDSFSQVSHSSFWNSNSSPLLRLNPRNAMYEPHAFASSSSSNLSVTTQARTSSLSSLSEATFANFFMSRDGLRTNSRKKAADSKNEMLFGSSNAVNDCVAVAVEKPPALEHLSLKSDEIYVNGREGHFLSTSLSDNSEIASEGSCVKNEASNKYSSETNSATKNFKETSPTVLAKSIKEYMNSTGVNKSRRGRRKEIKRAQTKNVSVTDDVGEKEKINEISHFKETGQQTQFSSSDGVRPRRMKKNIFEDSMTMQTRSSSGSLPKTCQTQREISGDKKLQRGLVGKKFHRTVCKESFTQRQLKRHQTLSSNKGAYRPTDSVTFMCPLCNLLYKGKNGLKRHFACKHLNTNIIPCYECKHKAKTLSSYLKHMEKHKPKQSEDLNSPPIQESQLHNSSLKCHECFKSFQSSDAQRLHVIDHKITSCLSQEECLLPLKCISNCASSDSKTSNYSSSHLHHAPHPTSTLELPQELKLQVERSLNSVIKMTSKLESLAHSLSLSCFSSVSVMPLTTIDTISTLSSQLSNLSTTLGQVLHCHVQESDEKDGKVSVDDLVVKDCDNVIETEQERAEVTPPRNDEIIQGNDGVIAVEKLQDIVLEDDVGLVTETDEVTVVKVKEPLMAVNSFTSKVKTNKNPRVKTKEQEARAGIHSRNEAKRRQREGGCITWKKMLENNNNKSSKCGHKYKCRECGKKLKNFSGLRRHLMIHKDIRPYKCNVCKISFRRSDHLKKHMVIHSDDRPFKCSVCAYAAKTAGTLHIHSLTHDEDHSFACQKCSYKGRTAYELSKHEEKHNPCSLCSYVATDNADYNIHKRSHMVYLCPECSYSCYSSWQMRRHSKIHNPPTPSENVEKFCCELCGYSCIEKRHFIYHMERHENKTPFSCSMCDYKCSSRASFDAHKLMHAGLRPFLCSVCGASFRRTSHLNNHMLVHKDEKKHICRTCGRPFRARQNLRAHEMIHTGERKYKCQFCSFACRRNRELKMHMTKHKVLDSKDEDSKLKAD